MPSPFEHGLRAEIYDDMARHVTSGAGKATHELFDLLEKIDETPDGPDKDRMRAEANRLRAISDDQYAWATRLRKDAADARLAAGENQMFVNFKAAAE